MTNKELVKLYEELKYELEELKQEKGSEKKLLYSVKEVAALLDVSVEGVYKFIRRGQLPTVKLGSTKIRAIDLEKFVGMEL